MDRSLRAGSSSEPSPDKPVQAAVRNAVGRIARFGPLVRGSRQSGFHDPEVHDREEVLRLTATVYALGVEVDPIATTWPLIRILSDSYLV